MYVLISSTLAPVILRGIQWDNKFTSVFMQSLLILSYLKQNWIWFADFCEKKNPQYKNFTKVYSKGLQNGIFC
jgi:hypothetical protein